MHFYDELLVNDCLLAVSPINNSDFGIWAGGLIFLLFVSKFQKYLRDMIGLSWTPDWPTNTISKYMYPFSLTPLLYLSHKHGHRCSLNDICPPTVHPVLYCSLGFFVHSGQ